MRGMVQVEDNRLTFQLVPLLPLSAVKAWDSSPMKDMVGLLDLIETKGPKEE